MPNEAMERLAGTVHGWPADDGGSCLVEAHDLIALIASHGRLLEALHEGRRAIGDHWAPNDCYATGPVTGDPFRDLVQCPACSFIAEYDSAIAKATTAAEPNSVGTPQGVNQK